MKRKVIQIAESTQLVSLPRKWAVQYGIKKGDELEVEEQGNRIMVSTERGLQTEILQLDVSHFELMIPRCIHALYKRGVDELKLTFQNEAQLAAIQKSLGKETVGFEIIEQGPNYCVVKNVSGDLEEFDQVLRRTFLLLITMADEGLRALKEKNSAAFTNIIPLEESNNRFTTTCRRFLNKRGYQKFPKVGPVYFIVEGLEKLADQYKYLYQYIETLDLKKTKIHERTIKYFEQTNEMLRLFYTVYYKFDSDKIAALGAMRKALVKEWYTLYKAAGKNTPDLIILHNLIILVQEIFNYVGPYLVTAL